MRTTLTLDDDVALQLDRLTSDRRTKLKTVVNEALRRGLREMSAPKGETAGYTTPEVTLGRCYLDGLDDVGEVLAAIEGEACR
jgi:hypothetical protein